MIQHYNVKDLPELMCKGRSKYRPGVLLNTPEQVNADKLKRTYKGVLYQSIWEMKRAVFLDNNHVKWTRQTPFWFGDGAWKYITDFQIFGKAKIFEDMTFTWNSHFEEVKGAARKRLSEIRRMWKAYGPLPLWIIHLEKGRWIIEEIIEP